MILLLACILLEIAQIDMKETLAWAVIHAFLQDPDFQVQSEAFNPPAVNPAILQSAQEGLGTVF